MSELINSGRKPAVSQIAEDGEIRYKWNNNIAIKKPRIVGY